MEREKKGEREKKERERETERKTEAEMETERQRGLEEAYSLHCMTFTYFLSEAIVYRCQMLRPIYISTA